jgi:hypothetical protein
MPDTDLDDQPAVRADMTHGPPPSQADRTAAAARLVQRHPDWSDRAVAAVTGLSNKTVSRIRATPPAPGSAPSAAPERIGRDGRRRPLDSGPRRRQAADLLSAHPELGLRAVARASGLSVATVRDVRQRLEAGRDPVPDRYRSAGARPAATRLLPEAPSPVDARAVLATLCQDPSLRFTDAGRQAVRWLVQHAVEPGQPADLARALPDHWAPAVAELARTCAGVWTELADRLQDRVDGEAEPVPAAPRPPVSRPPAGPARPGVPAPSPR